MKALSVRQPWAHLILTGRKDLELRTWEPRYTGRILIHAGRAIVEEACRRHHIAPDSLATGAILGSVEVVDVVRFTPDSWYRLADRHLDWGRFQSGLFGWQLRAPRALAQPIPWRGALGLFEVPDASMPPEIRNAE